MVGSAVERHGRGEDGALGRVARKKDWEAQAESERQKEAASRRQLANGKEKVERDRSMCGCKKKKRDGGCEAMWGDHSVKQR